MRIEKKQLVNDIGCMLKDSSFVYFAGYKGLSVQAFSDLRVELDKSEAKCHVLKNSLIKKAAELNNITGVSELELKDDTAIIIGNGDAGAVAKVLKNFSKENESFYAKLGYLDGEVLSKADVIHIADLPSKEVLQSQLLGVLQGVPRGLVTVMSAKLTSILNVINAYKDKLEQ